MDIKQILTDDQPVTPETQKPDIRQDFLRGVGASAIETNIKRKFNTNTVTIKTDKLIQLFREYFMPKRKTYFNSGDYFWAKHENDETPEELWKKLIFPE